MTSNVRLGAFIFVALIAFGMMIFWIGDKQSFFSPTYRLGTPFENVAGLEEGAAVRAGGVHIGKVARIILPSQPDDKIKVEMDLENPTRKVIKKDSIASIETEGLLGSKFVSISFGSVDAEEVRDGESIESRPPVDYADVARKASDMLETAKEAIDSSKVAIGNVNDASADLKSITGKIDSGRGTMGALLNDPSVYRNLNEMVYEAKAGATSFQENMEALKHNFFLRGFFKKRGYFDSSELTSHVIAKLPSRAPVKQFAFDGKVLFDKPDTAKLGKEKLLNQAGSFLESNPFAIAVVMVNTGSTGEKEKNLKLAQARAVVVRQYLAQKFKLDDARIKTMGVGESQQAPNSGSVRIVIYPDGRGSRTLEAKNK